MIEENETIVHTEEGIRISVSSWDDGGAYLHLMPPHGSLSVVMSRAEAQQILAGLQKVLNLAKEVAHA